MELVHVEYQNENFFPPLEILFRERDGGFWCVSFVCTVPHHCEEPMIYGDLYERRVLEIDSETVPIERGSKDECRIITRLQQWVTDEIPADEQRSFRHSKFSRMTQRMVQYRMLLWFIDVLHARAHKPA